MTTFDILLELPQGKLTHPLIAKWALERLHDQPEDSPRRNLMADSWFHDLTLEYWLASEIKDEDIALKLLLDIPTQRLAGFLPALERVWQESNYPHLAIRHLAELSPERTTELFLDTVKTPTSLEKALAMLEHLPTLDEESRRHCLDRLLQQLDASGAENISFVGVSFFAAAYSVTPDKALSLAVRLVDLLPNKIDKIEQLFSSFAHAAFGHSSWFELASRLLEDDSRQRFADLGEFFHPDIPFGAMDQAVSGGQVFEEARLLFQLAPVDHPAIRFTQYLLDHCQYAGNGERETLLREILGAFLLAAVAHAYERAQPEIVDLKTAIHLLGSEVNPLPWREKLLETLRNSPRDDVITALIKRMKETRHAWGEVHIAKIMGKLAYPEFSQTLIEAVSDEAGDFVCEKAKESLVRIGEPALPSLLSGWDWFDNTQRIYLLSAIQDIGGIQVADFTYAHFDELMGESLEYALDCLLSAPERRFIPLLAPHLVRRQWLIDKAYVVLCHLLDERPDGFEAVEARVLEKHKATQEKRKRFDSGDLFRDILPVEMCCTACGAVNTYDLRQLHVAVKKTAAPLPGEEFPCASCGAYAEFELTGRGSMDVLAGLTMLASERQTGEAMVPRTMLQFIEMPFEGHPRAINEIIALCRQRLAENPDDPRTLLFLGICYGLIHHPVKALERFSHVQRLAPLAAEVLHNLAQLLLNQGRKNEAWKVLENFPQQAAMLQFILSDHYPPKHTAAELARLYNGLRPLSAPALLPGAIATPEKTGRNDPCPCGSGKKYKKCCGGA